MLAKLRPWTRPFLARTLSTTVSPSTEAHTWLETKRDSMLLTRVSEDSLLQLLQSNVPEPSGPVIASVFAAQAANSAIIGQRQLIAALKTQGSNMIPHPLFDSVQKSVNLFKAMVGVTYLLEEGKPTGPIPLALFETIESYFPKRSEDAIRAMGHLLLIRGQPMDQRPPLILTSLKLIDEQLAELISVRRLIVDERVKIEKK